MAGRGFPSGWGREGGQVQFVINHDDGERVNFDAVLFVVVQRVFFEDRNVVGQLDEEVVQHCTAAKSSIEFFSMQRRPKSASSCRYTTVSSVSDDNAMSSDSVVLRDVSFCRRRFPQIKTHK